VLYTHSPDLSGRARLSFSQKKVTIPADLAGIPAHFIRLQRTPSGISPLPAALLIESAIGGKIIGPDEPKQAWPIDDA